MFEKDIVAIDINEERVAMLIGNKYKILDGAIIEVPKGCYENDNITDVKRLVEVIKPIISKGKKSKVNDVMFSIRGSDIISRHTIMPYGKDEVMRDSVEFELKQFIGDRINEYYFDYEVTNYDKNENNGNAEVLIVAVEKEKIETYLSLGKELGLNVKAIDIYANACARVFKNLKAQFTKRVKSAGIISIDGDSNSMFITEWGKLCIEKYQQYGLTSSTDRDVSSVIDYIAYLDSIDLTEMNEYEEQYDRFFQNIIEQYNSLIQFYSSGRVKKNLDKIYIMGSATRIRGIEQYMEVNFNTKVGDLPSFGDLKSSIKAPKKLVLKDYIYPYGLLLRKEQ